MWNRLEGHFPLHLAPAQSNAGPQGRKHDFGDAERLARRLMAGELRLSYVPDVAQRAWRTLVRARERFESGLKVPGALQEARESGTEI